MLRCENFRPALTVYSCTTYASVLRKEPRRGSRSRQRSSRVYNALGRIWSAFIASNCPRSRSTSYSLAYARGACGGRSRKWGCTRQAGKRPILRPCSCLAYRPWWPDASSACSVFRPPRMGQCRPPCWWLPTWSVFRKCLRLVAPRRLLPWPLAPRRYHGSTNSLGLAVSMWWRQRSGRRAPGLPLAIDCPPGPSEVLVIADETAPAAFVAADLLSQAEHGEDSAAILLTTSERLAHEVAAAVAAQIPPLPTAARIEAALERYGRILVLEDLDACVRFTNDYAPEHLEIMTADPWAVSRKIVNAGSVFLGHYSPVTMGDYLSGTNHVIPTGGYARMFSPLSVDEFVKKLEVQELTRQGLADTARVTPGLNGGRRFCGTPARCRYPFRVGKHHDGPGVSLAGSVCAACTTRPDAATLVTERHCAAHCLPHRPPARCGGAVYCSRSCLSSLPCTVSSL